MPGSPNLLRLVIGHIPDVCISLIRLSDEVYVIFDGSNLGIPRERMEDRSIWDCELPYRHELLSVMLSTVRRGQIFQADYTYIDAIHNIYAITVEEDGVEYALVVTRDVTLDRQEAAILRQRGAIDTLTGLPRRSVLQLYAEEQIRKSFPFTVIYIDLDNFKNLNDTHGHAAGDSLLREVSRSIQCCIRPEDLVVRLGGDEFCVILRQVKSSQTTWIVTERIRKAVRNASIDVGIECSIGTAFYPADGQNLDQVMAVADQRMYSEKAGHHEFLSYSVAESA